MDICFKEIPRLFGAFHIIFLVLICIISIFLMNIFRKKDEGWLISFLHYSGLGMMAAELWKQIFTHIYVFDRIYNMWFFPWQLCSMAMYCSFLVPYLNRKRQNTLLVFLCTFSLLAAIVALVGPLDMLRPQIMLTVHGFIYHGFMIFEAIAAYYILKKRTHTFRPALLLFVGMALIAEVINVIGHLCLHDIHREPDMFYITPYYASTQPVFHEIAIRYGIAVEIAVYLLAIILFSYLLYRILFGKNRYITRDDESFRVC